MTSRVVLVRGPRDVAASGGCCSGDVKPFDEGGSHRHAPRDESDDGVAPVYRALRAALPGDVAVEIVSPSNWLWLVPELVRGGRRRGLRGPALRQSVRAGMAVESLIVDGVVLASGGLPDPDTAVAAVEAQLALR
ncbi:hypothetical protein SAMN04515665_12565 [Blastococcus sp. DSM 46786]|uniref:hypothetical protein n=1 Tax=Blastococcus sp. DSM 46786 TaxID=1798227 RepID=UPI0008CCD612|nr:hypothetical protein [Blastococcus sp. DSM 46786]SEL99665.1 hypothetical protein SAMN04515665_12565 [Blastococcus sp. DSM 46786]